MTVVEAIGLALSAVSAIPLLGGPNPGEETERRMRSAYDLALASLNESNASWGLIAPVDESFLAREANWRLLVEEALGIREPTMPSELELSRFDGRDPDDESLAIAFLNAFRESLSRDAVMSTLIAAKQTASTVERTLGREPTRQSLLEGLLSGSQHRVATRLIAAGVAPEDAARLSDVLPVQRSLPEGTLGPGHVGVLVAPLGAGKSILAESVFQRAVRAAMSEAKAVPVWLDSRTLAQADLLDQVRKRVVAIGNPPSPALTLIVDGLDELDLGSAGRILDESRALAARMQAAVLLTTRATSLEIRQGESVSLQPLSAEKALSLASVGAGRPLREWDLARWPESIREAATLPLFALLIGLWLRTNPHAPTTTGELVEHLVVRALRDGLRSYDEAQRWLMVMAVESTKRSGPAAIRDLPHTGDLTPLLESGLVIADNGSVQFVLMLLQEWFAARALLEGVVSVEELLGDRDCLSRWRGALRALLSMAPTRFIHDVLCAIVAVDPGLVGDLVESGTPQFATGAARPPLPSSEEAGLFVREAMVAFHGSLGQLGDLIVPVDASGDVAAVGTYVDEPMLTVAWLRSSPDQPRVVALAKEDIGWGAPRRLPWIHMRSAAPSPSPAWPWSWAHGEIRDELTALLREGLPLAAEGPIAREAAWLAARTVLGRDWTGEPVSVAELTRTIERLNLPEDCHFVGPTAGLKQPLLALIPHLAALTEAGEEFLQAPWPLPDARPAGSPSWVWSFFTHEQLRLRVESVYSGALSSYEQLSTGLLAPLSPHLRKATLFPVDLRFFLRTSEGGWPGPGGTWHLLPIPTESENRVTVSIVDEVPAFEDLAAEARQAAEDRPDLANVALGDVTMTVLDVFGKRPITEICYQWLMDDLAKVHWTKGHTRVDLN
ncbi:MAG: hypothetical protein Q8K99_11260 [Actinomycetota bacterium]|nr:hypothetical protein [Actinomycetota bacterium]